MKTKGTFLAASAVGALLSAPSAFAAQLSDHPSLCVSFQREWESRQQGTLDGMLEFIKDPTLKKMCPKTESDAATRIAVETVRKQEADKEKARLDLVVASSATKAEVDEAKKKLTELENSITQDRKARDAAEAIAAEERRKRMELEAAASIPGRSRNLIACSISQDVEKFDQGNINGMKFDNIVMPPETQVVYDIQDSAEKVMDVYSFDLKGRQWTRNRTGAIVKGSIISLGSTSQNMANLQVKENGEINLDTMTFRGKTVAEPAVVGGPSAFNLDTSTGKGSLNLGALMSRPPRIWIELRGNCAYQNGDPPGPLTATPEFRVTSRDIPKLPKP